MSASGKRHRCDTPGCPNQPATPNARQCSTCNSRKHRTALDHQHAALREQRPMLAAWDAHVAANPRPARSAARWWR